MTGDRNDQSRDLGIQGVLARVIYGATSWIWPQWRKKCALLEEITYAGYR